MHTCSQCTAVVDLERVRDRRKTCPNCGARLRNSASDGWADVARVRNLAEAGFLSDELIGAGIESRIHQLDEFAAVGGRWATMYLIRVPSTMALDAAAHIREHLTDDELDSSATAGAFRFAADGAAAEPIFWRPVAIVILAGMASFVLGQRFSEQKNQRVERRIPRDSLAAAIESIGQPLVTEPPAGKPRHRLTFDRRHRRWVLDQDRDGDGAYDSRRTFESSVFGR